VTTDNVYTVIVILTVSRLVAGQLFSLAGCCLPDLCISTFAWL